MIYLKHFILYVGQVCGNNVYDDKALIKNFAQANKRWFTVNNHLIHTWQGVGAFHLSQGLLCDLDER